MTDSQPSTDERLTVDGAEFRFDPDGDLEIELTGRTTYGAKWTGVYLGRESAQRLKEFLNRMLP